MNTLEFKYHRGDKVILHGLLTHTKYNGTKAVVMGLREVIPNKYCPSGRAYYLDDLNAPEDWFYEERLKLDDTRGKQTKNEEYGKGVIALAINLYLEHDVNENEKWNVIRDMDYCFDHNLISRAIVIDWR